MNEEETPTESKGTQSRFSGTIQSIERQNAIIWGINREKIKGSPESCDTWEKYIRALKAEIWEVLGPDERKEILDGERILQTIQRPKSPMLYVKVMERHLEEQELLLRDMRHKHNLGIEEKQGWEDAILAGH